MRTPDGTGQDFPSALRDAIRASGLSLDRIKYRLKQRGVSITVTTLSYWQTGKRRPERPESLLAIAHLEQVFGLAAGSLVALLGPRRQRGRPRRPPYFVPLEALWTDRERITQLISRMRVGIDTGLTVLSLHDRLEVAADRGERSLSVRQVLLADRDGVDRWVTIYDLRKPGFPLPMIVPGQSCRLGQVARDHDAGLIAIELLFDRPLRRGETMIMEFTVINAGPPFPRGSDSFERHFRQPIRDYVVEVRFDRRALPTRCQQLMTGQDGTETSVRRDLTIDAAGRAHAVRLGVMPGTCRVSWGWDPD
jgi:hypothetical protein